MGWSFCLPCSESSDQEFLGQFGGSNPAKLCDDVQVISRTLLLPFQMKIPKIFVASFYFSYLLCSTSGEYFPGQLSTNGKLMECAVCMEPEIGCDYGSSLEDGLG